ncbi:MAG: SAM-dependent methyltransferase [Caulobacterales bacterium 32-69-10]|nr:MAG: SAM-dependent methyltransferase [Caulobacterales bacterium 32-69-10]
MNSKAHWEQVYRSKAPEQVSWYRPHLDVSLRLIAAAAPDRRSAVIDVGGGESTLVDDLVAHGYGDVSVLDISEAAIAVAKARLGAEAAAVDWIAGDITGCDLPLHRYDLWHDRAVFHFLTGAAQRRAYVRQVARAVKPGGHVIVATFGAEGPEQCSGLDVVRYEADGLHGEFGARFQLLEHLTEVHETPWGAPQQFLYCFCRKD